MSATEQNPKNDLSPTPPQSVPVSQAPAPVASPDQRKARLAQAIQQEIVAGGRIETQGDYNAVIRYGSSINHTLHLILSLVTLGMWVIVWLAVAVIQIVSQKTITLNVDEYGNMLRQRVK